MSEYARVPPIECLVALPLSDGDETYLFRFQFNLLEVGEHELQIDQLGESRA